MKNKLTFNTDFDGIDLKYAIPISVTSSLVFSLILVRIIPLELLKIKLFNINIVMLFIGIGNSLSLIIIYKLILRNKLLARINTIVSIFLSVILLLTSIFIPLNLKILAVIISILFVSSDEKYNNPSLAENIIVSLIRLINVIMVAGILILKIKINLN